MSSCRGALDFFREVLVTEEVFQSSESCRSRVDALVNVGVRGERVMDDRAQIFEALAELYKSRAVDEEARRVRSRVRLTRRSKVHRLGFGCRGAAANVHLKAKLAKVSKDAVGACYEVITRVEEERAVGPTAGPRTLGEMPMVHLLFWPTQPPGHPAAPHLRAGRWFTWTSEYSR